MCHAVVFANSAAIHHVLTQILLQHSSKWHHFLYFVIPPCFLNFYSSLSVPSAFCLIIFAIPSSTHFINLSSLPTEVIVPRILAELCGPEVTPTQHLETQQALVKQFAEILEFTLKFDELKVVFSVML